MAKTVRKLAAVILTVAMVIAFIPLIGTQTAYAADESTYARYDSNDNSLTFFTSSEEYTNGQTEGTLTYYADFTDLEVGADELPWKEVRADVKTVKFEDVIHPTSLRSWFAYFENLEEIDNIEKLDTSNVTTMRSTFYGCKALASVDVSGFDTSSVEDMNALFQECASLESLDVTGWDTSSVTDMEDLFYGCTVLTSLNLSSWNTSAVTNMAGMFYYCESLESLDLTGWDTSAVEDMAFKFVVKTAREMGAGLLVGEYIPSAKNAMVKNLLEDFGFTRLKNSERQLFTYSLDEMPDKEFFIKEL